MKKFSIYPAELNKEILNDSKLGGEIKVYNELKKITYQVFLFFTVAGGTTRQLKK